MLQSSHVLRNYRSMGPTRFHVFNQGVYTALADKSRFPDSIWGSNLGVVESYLATSQKHDTTYHEATLGSKLEIAQREMLQAELVILLDEIASLLEAAAVRNPGLLLAAGFDLAKDRRGHARPKAAAVGASLARSDRETEEAGNPGT